MSRARLPRKAERGAAAVELALLAPLLVALLVGAIELGLLLTHSQDLSAAAREGASFAGEDDTHTKDDIIERTLAAITDPTGVTVSLDPDAELPCQHREGETVTVHASAPSHLDFLFVATVPIDLAGTASFVCTNDKAEAATPAATPTASVTPSTASMCTVVDFHGVRKNAATGDWAGAGFTGAISFLPGSGNYVINHQTIAGNTSRACTTAIEVGP